MPATRLSSKGQVIIPKDVRERQQWEPGQAFDVIETKEGILLRPQGTFPETRLEDVAGLLRRGEVSVPVERLNMEAMPYQEPYQDEADDGR